MQRQQLPPIVTSKNMLLNMATSRKIWCKLDCCTDLINDPILIEFGEMDNIDDLKNKLFNKLNDTRWQNVNDNASVAIGFYQVKETPTNNTTSSNNNNDSINDRSQQMNNYNLLESPIFINHKNFNFGKQKEEISLTPPPDRVNFLNRIDSNNTNSYNNPFIYENSNETTPKRLSSASPKFAIPPKITIPSQYSFSPPPTASTYQFSTSNNSNKASAFLGPPTSLSFNSSNNNNGNNNNNKPLSRSSSYIISPSLRKPLNFVIEEINDTTSRITFRPDQLISELYLELFGSLGQQSASNPLLIFSNVNLSINQNIYNDQQQRQEQNDEDAQMSNVSENDTNDMYNDGNNDMISPAQSEDGVEFFQTDDETSQGNNDEHIRNDSNNDEEMRSESPPQAVLLLPKDYYENKKNSESDLESMDEYTSEFGDSKSLLEPIYDNASILSNNKQNTYNDNITPANEDQVINRPIRQLNQQDIGLVHPGLDEEWRKPQKPTIIPASMETDTSANNENNNNADYKDNAIMATTPNIETPSSSKLPKQLKVVKISDFNTPTTTPGTPTNTDTNPITTDTTSTTTNMQAPNTTTTTNTTTPAVPMKKSITTNTSDKVFPKINVLIVEDNVINQAILGSFLRKHKISYKIAKNGKEAVDIWKEGGLHLIFMDLQLPVLSGIEAAKQIRDFEKQKFLSSSAPVIIVALTASNSVADKREALISGCNDYLTKPVNLHWLSKKITEWGCMQALIDFDSWKQGQSRMTDSVIIKSPHKTKVREN